MDTIRSEASATASAVRQDEPVEDLLVAARFGLPTLTVIVPVYNELPTIAVLLRRVLETPWEKEVIVVDDGSTDGTSQALQEWQETEDVLVLRHTANCGKGTAIRRALEYATGRITIVQDGDLEYDQREYLHVLRPLLSGEADAVYGSRYLCPENRPRCPWTSFRAGVAALNLCTRLLYHVNLTDQATCYKAFPTATLRAMHLECERFEFCSEVTAKACRMGLRITEVPITYHARSIGEGKKIRWRDGWEAIKMLWHWRGWQPGPGPSRPEAPQPQDAFVVRGRGLGHRAPWALTVNEVLVVITIVGLLVALLLPAVQASREAGRRTQCASHGKQLGLALQQHASARGFYPSNGWGYRWVGVPERGTGIKQPGGWVYGILGYLEQNDLRDLGRDLPYARQRAVLKKLMQTPLPVLACPTRSSGRLLPADPAAEPFNADWADNVAKTDYAINEGDYITDTRRGPATLQEGDSGQYAWKDTSKATGISYQRSEVQPAMVRDGLSQTYMIGEKYVNRSGYDTSSDPGYDQSAYSGVDLDINRWVLSPPRADDDSDDSRLFGSAHPGGCHFVFCDGSLRLISFQIDAEVHRRLGNRRDGKSVDRD